MDKICELLTFEKITLVCPICGRKKTVATPYLFPAYTLCECGYEISTILDRYKAESEVSNETV